MMICPNMRAAQLYLRDIGHATIERVAKRLLVDPRVDLVLRNGQSRAADARRYLATSQRGHLEFWRGSDGPQRARDAFGTEWAWRGEDAALQLDVQYGVVESRDTRTLSRGSPGRWTLRIAAMCGLLRYLAVSSRSPAASRTSAAGRTAHSTRSIRSAP